MYKLNNTPRSKLGQTRNKKGNYEIYWSKYKWKYNITIFKGWKKISFKKEVYNDKCSHYKKKRAQINNLTLHLKELDKEE